MNAAVADFRPAELSTSKIKKGDDEELMVRLVRNPDILAGLAARRNSIKVGFAAETQDLIAYARSKLERKGLDMIIANEAVSSIGQEEIQVLLLDGEYGSTIAAPAQSARGGGDHRRSAAALAGAPRTQRVKKRMEEQDKGIEEQSNGDTPEPTQPRAEQTQVGQVMQTLSRATRQLTAQAPAPSKRAVAQAANAALRDRIASLIVALGDPHNPLHHQAVDDLMAIGAPAVPALNDALSPNSPRLTAYRAAETLGQIGDGRAAGALLEALRHPNSNVRWSAVRALAVVGDARALLELRRVARDDQSKTSWGESVGGTAQSVLDQMQSHNMILRGADLIKTAVACVLMLVALILAWSIVNALRTELRAGWPRDHASRHRRAARADGAGNRRGRRGSGRGCADSRADRRVALRAQQWLISGTALFTGNVRALPSTSGQRVGGISEGDEIIFLATTPDPQLVSDPAEARGTPTARRSIVTTAAAGPAARCSLIPWTKCRSRSRRPCQRMSRSQRPRMRRSRHRNQRPNPSQSQPLCRRFVLDSRQGGDRGTALQVLGSPRRHAGSPFSGPCSLFFFLFFVLYQYLYV